MRDVTNSVKDVLAKLDKEFILDALEEYEWNVEVTSEALDIPLSLLYDKLNDFGLSYEMPKKGAGK